MWAVFITLRTLFWGVYVNYGLYCKNVILHKNININL
jgi:hypothetical protein